MKPSQDVAKRPLEKAEDSEFDFSTSGNAARHHVRPLETQRSEGFKALNESDNKLGMLRVNRYFHVHVMRRRAKVKCFERGQMTRQSQMFTSQKLIAHKITFIKCKLKVCCCVFLED